MSVTTKEVEEIEAVLRRRGGSCTLRELAGDVGRNVNGLSQRLNSPKFDDIVMRGTGKGGGRIISLVS